MTDGTSGCHNEVSKTVKSPHFNIYSQRQLTGQGHLRFLVCIFQHPTSLRQTRCRTNPRYRLYIDPTPSRRIDVYSISYRGLLPCAKQHKTKSLAVSISLSVSFRFQFQFHLPLYDWHIQRPWPCSHLHTETRGTSVGTPPRAPPSSSSRVGNDRAGSLSCVHMTFRHTDPHVIHGAHGHGSLEREKEKMVIDTGSTKGFFGTSSAMSRDLIM